MTTHHVMLDLETFGTKPGCPILSIGASLFKLLPASEVINRTAVHFSVAIQEDQERMDGPDPATIVWWKEQSEEARIEVFNSPNAIHIADALPLFSGWLNSLKGNVDDRIIIWGNGATFDEPILKEAYRRYNMEPVWTFRDSLCFRTLKELGKIAGISEPEFTGVKHTALADAAHQAKWADLIFKELVI